jgi:sarcosine oxidase delta subunit
MMLIPCPHCGPRNQIEFTYGGDATLRRPAADAPEAAWIDYVYLRDNPCGPHDEPQPLFAAVTLERFAERRGLDEKGSSG